MGVVAEIDIGGPAAGVEAIAGQIDARRDRRIFLRLADAAEDIVGRQGDVCRNILRLGLAA